MWRYAQALLLFYLAMVSSYWQVLASLRSAAGICRLLCMSLFEKLQRNAGRKLDVLPGMPSHHAVRKSRRLVSTELHSTALSDCMSTLTGVGRGFDISLQEIESSTWRVGNLERDVSMGIWDDAPHPLS